MASSGWSGTGTVAVPASVPTLHHHMTTALPDLAEAVFFKNLVGVSAGKNAQFTHALLRSVL